jgi:Cu-Zn family superoxide dismutase
VLPGTPSSPEGIAADQRTGTFWVSSTTDGTIFRGTVKDPTAEVFLPGGTDGRTTAIGLEYSRGILYVAGGATGDVWLYGAYSGRLIARLDTGVEGTFINDVASRAAARTSPTRAAVHLPRLPAGRHLARGAWLNYSTTVIPFVAGFNSTASPRRRAGGTCSSSTPRPVVCSASTR